MDDSAVLAEMAEEFAARWRRGERPDVEEYATKAPALAERVRALFPTLMLLEGLAAGGAPADQTPRAEMPQPGETFGAYRVGREVGRGGMGIVFEAEHLVLRRRVALKVLPLRGGDAGARLERFLREARTAAALHHGNVVPVFDVGQVSGQPYYAMQLIDGVSLDKLPRGPATVPTTAGDDGVEQPAEAPASTIHVPDGVERFRWAAEVGRQAAQGLTHAHARGVIHRDIKPSNLMIDHQGNVWITDFGLAKRLDQDVALTASGQIVGTPRYASPEQAAAKKPIDHRTDVYSLGATLYELVTRRPPFDGPTPLDVLLSILERQPVPPRRLDPSVPRDLETVVLKAMAKRPEDRYATAEELGEDLRRFREGQPVAARRIGPVGRALRWSRQNPVVAALLALVFVSLAAGTMTSTWFALRAEQQRIRAVEGESKAEARARAEAAARQEAAWRLYLTRANFAATAWQGDEMERLEELLDAMTPDEGQEDRRNWEWHFLRRQLRVEQRRLDLRGEGWNDFHDAFLTADGRRVIWKTSFVSRLRIPNDPNSHVEVRDAQAGRLIRRRTIPSDLLNCARADGAVLALADGEKVVVWDVDRDQVLTAIEGVDVKGVRLGEGTLALCPSGDRLAVGSHQSGKVALIELKTGKTQRELIIPKPTGKNQSIITSAFSPDGRWLAVSTHPGLGARPTAIFFWDTRTGKQMPAPPASWVVFDRQGQRVAYVDEPESGPGRGVCLWDLATGKDLGAVSGLEDSYVLSSSLAFSPDGKWLAAGNSSGVITLACIDRSQPGRRVTGHRGWVRGVAFLDDVRLRSFSEGVVNDWDLQQAERRWLEASSDWFELPPSQSADGSRLAFVHHPDGRGEFFKVYRVMAKVFDVGTGQLLFASPPGWQHLPGGIALDGTGGTLARVRDCRRHELHSIEDEATRALVTQQRLARVQVWMPTGGLPDLVRVLAATDGLLSGLQVEAWDVATGRERFSQWLPMPPLNTFDLLHQQLHQTPGTAPVPRLSPDGRYLALEGTDAAAVWDLSSGRRLAVSADADEVVHRVSFTGDGHLAMLTGTAKRSRLDVWKLDEVRRVWRFDVGRHELRPSALASDGDVVVLAGLYSEKGKPEDGASKLRVRCWSLLDGNCSINEDFDEVNFEQRRFGSDVLLSVRGSRVAVAWANTLNAWDAGTGERLFRAANLGPSVTSLVLSPDGSRLAGVSHHRTTTQPQLHLLDVSRGESLLGFSVRKAGSGKLDSSGWSKAWFRGHKLHVLTSAGPDRWELHTLDGTPR